MLQKGSSITVPRGATTYYLKCLVSNNKEKNYKAYKETGKCDPYTGKKAGHRNCLSERPDVRFIIKDFKVAI